MELTMEQLSTKTVMALKAYAKKNKIELFEANTKLEILEIISSWFPPTPKEGQVDEISPKEKIAVYSEKNLHMDNLKPLFVGYNIISKEASERWLNHKAVRIATPEEVASYYGK